MNRILIAVAVCIASCMMAESLVCNKCMFTVAGKCVGASTPTCATNTSQCGSQKYSYTISNLTGGFYSYGCLESKSCNSTVNGVLLGVVSTSTVSTCCSTDKCNTVTSGAPSAGLSAALAAFLLVSLWASS